MQEAEVTPVPETVPEAPISEPAPEPQPETHPEWVGTPRNAQCPCGSGKKYKKCHGCVIGDVKLPKIGSPKGGMPIEMLQSLANEKCNRCHGRGFLGFMGYSGSRVVILCPGKNCAKTTLSRMQMEAHLQHMKERQEAKASAQEAETQEEKPNDFVEAPTNESPESPSTEGSENGNAES
jgi:hypothetical protein